MLFPFDQIRTSQIIERAYAIYLPIYLYIYLKGRGSEHPLLTSHMSKKNKRQLCSI